MKTFDRPIQTAEVHETNKYNQFQHLTGNRKLQSEKCIANLMWSLKEYGWIGAPIVVNENLEIIDGQNRIEACRRLGIPVRYIIIEGLTIVHCIALNTNQKNWDLDDYVKSYAEQGYEDYIWLMDVLDKYPKFTLRIVLALSSGNGYHTDLRTIEKQNAQNGGLEISDERKQHVLNVLDFLMKFPSATNNIDGRKFMLYNALIWWYFESGCDIDRLIYCVNKYSDNEKVFPDKLTQVGFVYSIQNAYNYNRPHNTHIHVKDKYDTYVRYGEEKK